MSIRLPYTEVAPEGFTALSAFGHYIHTGTALDAVLLGFVDLRASQLNGCEFCIAMHSHELLKHHEPQTRIDAVAYWLNSDAFTPRERAALAWTEVVTRLAPGGVSDADYAAVSEFFGGKDLVDLTYAIANINAWNRLGIAFRPAWNPGEHARKQEAADTSSADGQTRSAVGDDGGKVAED